MRGGICSPATSEEESQDFEECAVVGAGSQGEVVGRIAQGDREMWELGEDFVGEGRDRF